MRSNSTALPRARAALRVLACALAASLSTGCYYAHLATGQARLLLAREPFEAILADPATAPDLAGRLRLAGEVRSFALELGLDVGRQYTSYVDWPGDRVVTTIVATRPGEIEARPFWFPVVGRVPYKGFFDPALAEREAAALRGKGLDTCVVPVLAYSTLGWLADPLTAPLARLTPSRLAETLLHELLHATVYVGSEPEFNEGLATFVGQEAAVRFFARRDGSEAAARERRRVEEDRRVAALLLGFRERVRALYEREPPGPSRDAARAALDRETRAALAALPLETRDPRRTAEAARLNDACQALAGTYQADLASYAETLDRLGGDLAQFVAEARRIAEARDPRARLLGVGR
jgi:predicted aminopeptidase